MKTASHCVLLFAASCLALAALFLATIAGRVAWDVVLYHWAPDGRQAVAPR